MPPSTKQPQAEASSLPRRSMRAYIRGGLTAAFSAAVIGGGITAYQQTKPPSPYSHPRAADAYHIPARDCANVLTSDGVLPPAPRGNGAPVMLIPGLLGNDTAMRKLGAHLKDHGYTVYGWDQGFNIGMTEEKARALDLHLNDISLKHPGQKIALVGFSLGGVYARELARGNPDIVSQVITLGSPFALTDKSGNLDKRMYGVAKAFNPQLADIAPDAIDTRASLPVPATSLYSVNDRLVMWKSSLNRKEPATENIPVAPGHLGMTLHEKTAHIILHRLAETPHGWQPLAPRLCPAAAR